MAYEGAGGQFAANLLTGIGRNSFRPTLATKSIDISRIEQS